MSRRCSSPPSSHRFSPAVVAAARYRTSLYRLSGGASGPTTSRGFRYGQVVTASLLSLAHGTNDAQKTMGIITLALIAHGSIGGRRERADLGDRLRPRSRSRSAPTPVAGG